MVFIVKVPGINGLGKTNGCEKAGNAILNSLKEIYSNEQGKPIDVNLLDLEEIHLDNYNLELTNKLIYKNALEIYGEKPKVVFLGGDHSISFSTTKAFLEYCRQNNKEPCLVVFDAHPDCMEPVDENFPTHEEWLRGLIEKGFPSENILLVGVRNLWKDELEFLAKNKIKTISMNQLQEDLHETCDSIMEFSNTKNLQANFGATKSKELQDFVGGKELYVSIDIDVIDPAFAPATGYCEPGGLTSREFLYILQRINKIKNLKAVDIVGINPAKDTNGLTVKLSAKILSELI